MLNWLIGGAAAVVVAVAGWIWYNARRAARAEDTATAERTLREMAEKRADSLEAQRAAENAAAHDKDASEGSAVVTVDDGWRFVRDSLRNTR